MRTQESTASRRRQGATPRPGSPSRTSALTLLVLLPATAGCYSLGVEPALGLEEIAVPVFTNRTLRRGLEHDLTRHVRREILETTPLQLAHESGSAVLRGTVVELREGLLLAGPAEEVLESSVRITVSFGVYRGQRLLLGEDSDGDGAPDGEFVREGFAEFDTTRGESRETATDEALRDLAEVITFQLTAREDDRFEPNDSAAEAQPLKLRQQLQLIQRNPDWFAVQVPPGRALEATLYHSGALALSAHDPQGAPLPDAEVEDEARLVRLPAADEERTVLLHVSGDDTGATYRLSLQLPQ